MAMDLGKQVGPLPLGAWLAVVGTGLGFAYYTKKQAASVPMVDTSGNAGVGTGDVGGFTSTVPGTTSVDTTPVGNITDNDSWGRAVVNFLIAEGYDPAVADSAVRKYLGGEKLSVQEWAMLRIGMVKYGAPPSALPPGPGPTPIPKPSPPPKPPKSVPGPVHTPRPAPKPKPPPRKPAVRHYTVVSGDNLTKIAARFYGNGAQWPRIFAANVLGKRRADGTMGMIASPNFLRPGWVLVIP